MEIKAASRGFSLFIILICAIVACGCALLLVALASFGRTTAMSALMATLIAIILAAIAGWMIYCIRLWVLVYRQYPTFKIVVEPGALTITNRGEPLTVRSSDIAAYYLYNNKVRVVLHDQTNSRSFAPFAQLKGDRLTISLNRLDGRIPVTTWLHKFDRDFNVKSRANLGMIAQALGYGLS